MGNKLAFEDLISIILGKLVEKDTGDIYRMVERLSSLAEEEFKGRYLCGETGFPALSPGMGRGIFRKLIGWVYRKSGEGDSYVRRRLAVGVEAFRRCPADLKDTQLYPQQVKAAIALTSSCVLQMNTGEGKTYALLPAAYALAGRYGRVYVVCANPYLAYRDAKRTKPYWDYVGLNVQYIESSVSNRDVKWEGEIIYTTLTTLMFKALNDDLYGCPDNRKLVFHALLIDEIDAALLDDHGLRSVIMSIRAKAYDWERAIRFARRLEPETEITVNVVDWTAALTVEGENKLKDFFRRHHLSFALYGQMREAVEYSYIALNARENQDYVIQDGRLYSLNRLSGELERGVSRAWLIPLEILKRIRPRNHSLCLHGMSSDLFIRQFDFVAGMSGTAREDASEYLFAYGLPTAVIEPRVQRYKGELLDECYSTRKGAVEALCDRILDEACDGRPVLVGTQSISDAREVYDRLLCLLEENAKLFDIHLITGQDDEGVAGIYEHGGEVGSIIIATQVSGRGVDIRVSDEARENGGLALLGFERSLSQRHDRQFLGRAGRQGDVFTAQFMLSLEGQLMREGNSSQLKGMWDAMKIEEDQAMQSKQLSGAIRAFQNRIRRDAFYRRRYEALLVDSEEKMYFGIRDWLQNLNYGEDGNAGEKLTENFLNYAVACFLQQNLSNSMGDNMDGKQSAGLVRLIGQLLPSIDEYNFNAMVLEGKRKEFVAREIAARLKRLILEREEDRDVRHHRALSLFRFMKREKFPNLSVRIGRVQVLLACCRGKEKSCDEETGRKFDELYAKMDWIGDGSVIRSEYLKRLHLFFDFLEKNIYSLSPERLTQVSALTEVISKRSYWQDKRIVLGNYVLKLERRDGYHVAYWTILQAGIRYREYKRRIIHIYSHQELNLLEYNRRLTESLDSEWVRTESALSSEVLKNLLANPLSLDALFVFKDSQVRDKDKRQTAAGIYQENWDKDSGAARSKRESDPEERNEKLIRDFVLQAKLGLGLSFNQQSLRALLKEFLLHCPVNTLQSPEKIVSALEDWKRQEVLLCYTKERKKLNHKWILEFLKYLSVRRMIAALPTFKYYLRSRVKKLIHDLKDFNTLQSLLRLAVFVVLFAALSMFGTWLERPDSVPEGLVLIDNLLCAGFILRGIVTAPVVALSKVMTRRVLPPFRYTLLLAFVLFYMSIFNPIPGLSGLPLWLLFCAAIAFVYLILVNLYDGLALNTQLPLFSVWIAFGALIAFLPEVARYGEVPALAFILATLYCAAVHARLNQQTLTFLSTEIVGSAVNLESTVHRISEVLGGYVGCAPHMYALAGSFLLSVCLRDVPAVYRQASAVAVVLCYGLLYVVLTQDALRKRFSVDRWRNRLNERKLMLIDGKAEGIAELSLEPTLNALRRRIVLREMLLQTAMFALCVLVLGGYRFGESRYPLALVILPASFWFGEHLSRTVTFLYRLFSYNGQVIAKTVSFEDIKEPEEEKTFTQKLTDFLNPFFSAKKVVKTILVLLGILAALNERFRLLDKLLSGYF